MKQNRRYFIKLTGIGIMGSSFATHGFNLNSVNILTSGKDSLEGKVTTLQKKPVELNIRKDVKTNQGIYSVSLKNNSGTDLNLDKIILSAGTEKPVTRGTPYYLIGIERDGTYDGNILISKTEEDSPKSDNNMFVMFKLGENDYLLIGVASWRTFLCKIFPSDGRVQIVGDGDKKLIRSGENLEFEKVVFLRGSSWLNLTDRYVNIIAKENRVKPQPPVNWKGWATWDYYGQKFLTEDIIRNIKEVKKIDPDINLIQIDGGWWKIRGDYFEARDNIPGGIKNLVEIIHQNGCRAGLHFDGFRASVDSKVAREHPEYFLHAENGELLLRGKDQTNRPLVIWDYSHPGAREYFAGVLENAKKNWKVDYFKIDFMRDGLVTKGVSYLPVTNVERHIMGLKAMKKSIGDGYFLGCGAHPGVNIGLNHAIRTGKDIFPYYSDVKKRAQQNSGKFYLNKKVYHCDPDYLVLRSLDESNDRDIRKPTLSYDQASMWKNFITIFGNIRLSGDEVELLAEDKKDLIRKCFAMPFFEEITPIDFWDHYKSFDDAPNLFLARGENKEICLGLFNWDEKESVFNIHGFNSNTIFSEFTGNKKFKVDSNQLLSIKLRGTKSMLLKYEGKEPYEKLREIIKLKKNHKLYL